MRIRAFTCGRRIVRAAAALVTGAAWLAAPVRLPAHAGHDHAPEAPVETVGEVAPRFYGQSDGVEAVLVFPEEGPRVFLLSRSTNEPVEGASVSAEVLSGAEAKVAVAPGGHPGAYLLNGLGAPQTTTSLMLEISRDDLLEIVSIDNIAVPEDASVAEGKSAVAPAMTDLLFGLPRYLVVGLIAINVLVAMVFLAMAFYWVVRLVKGPEAADGEGEANRRRELEKSALLLLAVAGLALSFPRSAPAHAGEDHSGAALAASAALTSGTRHFVPVQTQVEGDIRTTRVREMVLPRAFRALGRVEIRSDHRAVVTPPVEGRLVVGSSGQEKRHLPVEGEFVRKGQTLLVVEQILPAAEKVTLTTERAQLEAELRQAEQELNLASQNKERAERLASVIAGRELQETRAQYEIARDRVAGLKRRIETLASALSGTGPSVREVPVIAPISGSISQAHATVGEYVTRDKSLFTIVSLDEVFVGADVFESDLSALQGATRARVTLEAYPDEAFEGTLHAISQEVNPETRAVHVLFSVKNPDQKLRGGAFVNVAIESDERRPVLVVPKDAVLSQDGVRRVLRKVTPEVFAADPVIVSEFREDVAVIERGLKKDDRIAVTGLYQIRMSPTLGAEQ